MYALDTTPEIEQMQIGIRRAMSSTQRFHVALDISHCCRELRKAGIRREHPNWSGRQV